MKLYEKLLLGGVGTAGAGLTAWKTMFPWIGYDLQLMNTGRKLLAKRVEAMESFLIDKFEKHVANQPKKPFIIFEDAIFTYEYVDQMANKVANLARSWGLKALDVVAMMIQNEPAFVWTFLGKNLSQLFFFPFSRFLSFSQSTTSCTILYVIIFYYRTHLNLFLLFVRMNF